MISSPQTQQRRPGFTLVEMLVSMALILFIMVILSDAFVAALESFRRLKAIGDMEDRMRSAATFIRADLSADHFESRKRLSDPNFYLTGPPREGFLRIYQPLYSSLEGTGDADGNYSYVASTSAAGLGQTLHMTVKLRGNRQEDFFKAYVPPSSSLFTASTTFFNQTSDFQTSGSSFYYSPWAEVAYFIVQVGSTTEPNNPMSTVGSPLYALYRAQFVVVPDTMAVNTPPLQVNPATPPDYTQMSCNIDPVTQNVTFYNPSDLASGTRTFTPLTTPTLRSATLLLTDVLSWDIQIYTPGATDWADVVPHSVPPPVGTLPVLPAPAYDFDTATGTSTSTINAIRISIRVWDAKTLQARQMSIIQDM
jgi:prepilin-type N-terminal cleavage/methylation domain-containing protein